MQHTIRRARPAATLAAALGLALTGALLAPGAALAATTEPPVTTTTAASTPTASTGSTTPSGTTSSSTTPSGTTTTVPPTVTSTTVTSTTGTTASNTTAPTTKPPTTTTDASRARIAAAAVAVPESQAAADFIARTLAAADDHYVYPGSTYFDGGNTIDAILALDAVGTQTDQADASYAYLDANVGSYIGTDFDSLYAGPAAKALLAAVAHGADPTDVGGLDLIAALRDAEDAVEPGRFSDLPVDCGFDQCDYSNTIGQSLALIALSRAGEPLNAASVAFLLDQQCSDGGFRGSMEGAGCTSDPDATAFAAQALVASSRALLCGTGAAGMPTQAAAALDAALDRLAALQGGSGALSSSDGTPNANTTGMAAQAFYAGGRVAEGDAAASFIVTLQYDPTTAPALQGGIAYSATTRSTTTPSDTDLRATPQATLALAGGSLAAVVAPGVVDAPMATVCPVVATSSTTSTTTTSTTTSSTTSAGAAPISDPAPASATPGSLALTGSDVAPLLLLALGLVLLGGIALTVSRRKGAHA